MVALFTVPCLGSAQGLPTPVWSISTSISSDDGYAELRWTVAGSDPVNFYRLTELFEETSSVHFVDHPTTRLYRIVPGRYEFQVQACERDTAGYPTCGQKSPLLALTITDAVESIGTPRPRKKSPPKGQVRNPSDFTPGRWHNPDREGHGWSFYWKSRLALPEGHPEFGDAWDLVGLWYTYEAKLKYEDCSGGCDWVYEDYRPVYARLALTEVSDQQYYGTVYITRSGIQENVGSVSVTFDTATTATLNWGANFLWQYFAGSDDIELLVGPDSEPADNPAHYSGLWEAPMGASYLVADALGWTSESIEVVFEDGEGHPSWVMAVGDDPVPGRTDLCFFYISEGFPPGTTGPIWFYENECDSDVAAGPGNRNGFREFTGFESEDIWVDFELPGGTAPEEFVAGSVNNPHSLDKYASFHRVSYDSTSGPNCQLIEGLPDCIVSLTWSTDGNFPETSVFAHNSSTGERVLVGTAMVMQEFDWCVGNPGQWEFELRMGDSADSALMGLSESFAVSGENSAACGGGNPETPPDPVPPPDMTPSVASSSVGATGGSFTVSPTGSANYNIPLLSGPGSGGSAPDVSLVYDSQSGNGPVGVGWGIDGFSVISRCAQTLEQDVNAQTRRITFTGQDRFCLDGERLMAISGAYGQSGTEYRKERDDFTRLVSYGGSGNDPSFFRGWNRDGILFEFGGTSDSRIETRAEGIEDVAYAWVQNRVEDTAGNYMEYAYSERGFGPVDFVLETILYTGNTNAGTEPYAELRFVYGSSRPDNHTAYIAGVPAGHSRLLSRIDSLSSVTPNSPLEYLRSYQLDYGLDGWGRSALESLTECRDPSGSVCFEPTTFDWLKSEHQVSMDGPEASSLFTKDFRGMAVGDANGDGRPDLLITERKGAGFEFGVATGGPSGAFSLDNKRFAVPQSNDPGKPVGLTVIDLNGDGFQDVIYVRKTAGTVNWHARLAGPEGMGNEFVILQNCCGLLSPPLLQVMDFNGDGLSDVMTNRPIWESGEASEIVVMINDFEPMDEQPSFKAPLVIDVNYPELFPASTPTGWQIADDVPGFAIQTGRPWPGRVDDFYGDGSADILVRLSRYYRRCTVPCPPNGAEGSNGSRHSVFIIGSGGINRSPGPIPDPAEDFGTVTFYVVFFADESGEYSTYEIVATGAGEDCNVSEVCSLYFQLPSARATQPADINADGLADVTYIDEDFDWYYRLNSGNGFLATQLIGRPPDDERAELARFIDITGDGFPEMLYPSLLESDNAIWKVHHNDLGQGFSAPMASSMPAGNSLHGDSGVMLDFTADGILDQLFIDWRADGNGAEEDTTRLRLGVNLITSQTAQAPNVISTVENGFGARNLISYSPLTDPLVHSRMRDSANAQWGRGSVVYDLSVPYHVVSAVETSAPVFGNSNTTSVRQFHYVGAKIQGGGRGFLGFAEVVEWDPQTKLRYHTLYRQDFPYLGLVSETGTFLSDNSYRTDSITDISSSSPSEWPVIGPATAVREHDAHGEVIRFSIREYSAVESKLNSGAWLVQSPADLDREYTLQGNFKGKTYTSRDFDAFGNIDLIEVRRYKVDNTNYWSMTSTESDWINNVSQWRLGRLGATEVTQWRSGAGQSIVRRSSYTYHPQSDLLVRETAEPGHATRQVVTEYFLDDFGNQIESKVTGIGMPSRSVLKTFDPLGRFAVRTKNAYNQTTADVDDWDAFGNPLKSYNIDGVLTLSASDRMGRPFVSYSETGSWKRTEFGMGGHARCPNATASHSITTGGGAPTSVDCFDRLGRKARNSVEGFLGAWINTDTYFDRSGGPERISEPYFAGQTRYWNLTEYDALGRVTRVTGANGLLEETFFDESSAHCGQSGPRTMRTRTFPGDGTVRDRWELQNLAGETERVLDNNCGEVRYGYDAVGNLVETEGIDGSVILVNYDSLGLHKVQVDDPDKGLWQYASNALGEVTRQLDNKQQAIDFKYDQMGRVVHRRELAGVANLDDSTYQTRNHEARTWQNSTAPGIQGRGKLIIEKYRVGEAGAVLHSRSYSYDGFGRVDQVDHDLDGEYFSELTTYDAYGRVFQQFDASGHLQGVRFSYNSRGYLQELKEARDGVGGIVYQRVEAMDSRGNPTAIVLGNGTELFGEFDPASGFVNSLEAYDADGAEMQLVDYQFDRLGNLLSRHDRSGSNNLREDFRYDLLDRLEKVLLTAPALGLSMKETQSQTYDNSGNITYKSGVGAYTYGLGNAGPHAVTRAGTTSYTYDGNGNQLWSSAGRIIEYGVFDKPTRIEKGQDFTEFDYGLGNMRYKRTDNNAVDGQKTTLSVGNIELIQEGGSDLLIKRYIGNFAIVDYYPSSESSNAWYLAKGHLGSIHTISDASGQKVQENHFGPWGIRLGTDWQTPLAGTALSSVNGFTTRGFTGHEHADGLGVVHMNGRIYDPRLGRFLQADPFVQAPRNGQSLNRYSYALNNPLSYTDPSGYFFKRLIRKWGRVIIAAVAAYFTFGAAYAWAATALANAAAAGTFVHGLATISTIAAAAAGATAGFVSGAIIAGSLRGAVKSAFAGAITGGINRYFGQRYTVQRVAVESIGGGVNARILGGEFEDGLKFSLIVSGLNYANYRMRQVAGAVADRNPANTGKPSSGFYGDQTARAGALRTPDPDYPLQAEFRFRPCDSVAGACQGRQVINPLDVVQSRLGPMDYPPYGTLDYITESFAGPHDWLRLMTGSYDPITGLNINRVGLDKLWDGVKNYGLVPIAAPFAVAGILTTSPNMHLVIQEHLYGR